MLLLGLIPSATASATAVVTWQVQSDYFGERNAIAQPRTIRSLALSADGQSIYTGNIQSPNVATNAITAVSSDVLAVPGTDHVIFGNGRPGGTGGFRQLPLASPQPVYAGGSTGKFLGWKATPNSPRGLAADDRGYVYVGFTSGISPAQFVGIYDSGLTTLINSSIPNPTGMSEVGGGVAVHEDAGHYYLYVASNTMLRRYNVDNVAAPALDSSWNTPSITSGADSLAVDYDGTVFLAGGGAVRRISPDGAIVTHTFPLSDAADVAVYQDKVYVIRQSNIAVGLITVLNKADLTSAGSDLAVPGNLNPARVRSGSLAQFTAIDVSADGRLFVSEENYSQGLSCSGGGCYTTYTPPVTSFNPSPGAITGRIYFDRVLVSSSIASPEISPDQASVTVGEGDLAQNTGSFILPPGSYTWSASVGAVTPGSASGLGTWSWQLNTSDGPDESQMVTIEARDDGAALVASTSFTLSVDNIAPGGTFNSPATVLPSNSFSLSITAPSDVAADLPGLTYSFDCGNGSFSSFSATTAVTCLGLPGGSYTVRGEVQDKDGGVTTFAATLTVSAGQQAKQGVIDALTVLKASTDDKPDRRIDKAIARLQKSLSADWWEGPLALDPKEGKHVFDEEKKVVHELSKKELKDNATAQMLIEAILSVDRSLATYAIPTSPVGTVKQHNIDKAWEEILKGDAKAAEGKYEEAIEHYKHAWDKVNK